LLQTETASYSRRLRRDAAAVNAASAPNVRVEGSGTELTSANWSA